MNILVLNPNTSLSMSSEITNTLNKISGLNSNFVIANPDFGVDSLESFYEYNLATFGCIRYINNTSINYDGILLACFGDPGLYALKEIAKTPVIGIAEAAMSTALLLGRKFGILVASQKAVPMMESLVREYGLESRLSSILTINIPVSKIEENKVNSYENLYKMGMRMLEEGAEVIILGCAGMTGFSSKLSKDLNVPVVDPIECGFNLLENLIKQNLKISKIAFYKEPEQKEIFKRELLDK
ncbi:aspartate/glutamate racemase family protein [Psychrobacillus sp. INOP01]|uniref:aspartate/glutamate racemase family protein n=1 Tax=Psychrobacillus sp. INOP01 TaxID=2829187 RepID=UPI001BA72D79|nr:aspartate/glutamate racemase family protein [Psychrobacillus sp. INOP01]QUG40616.1 aspartate/glutamate racemase family protein [Psychrobacillus sp. INOP01]